MEPDGQLELIEEVKKYPYLYDRRVLCAPGKKELAWEVIGMKFSQTARQAQMRWRSIRDRYTRLRRNANAFPGTQQGILINEYKYTEFLGFLDSYISWKDKNLTPKRTAKYIPPITNSWDRAHTLLLIKQLKNNPLLWDSSHPYYNFSLQRMICYKKICDYIKPYKPEVTPTMISRKIRTVRTQYAKEKREAKQRNQKLGGISAPKLWCYHRLSFLETKGTYDLDTLNNSTEKEMKDITVKYEKSLETGEYLDEGDYEDDDDDDDYNDNEWTSAKESATRPFEEVELNQMDHDYTRDSTNNFESEIEDVFGQSGTRKKIDTQTKNDLYVKCTGLLDTLVQQMKPLHRDGILQTTPCNCKNSPPSTVLGKMVETELSKVSDSIYVDCKWKILHVLEEAQRRSLREKQNQNS
ncbi:uncharacterized protein LOC129916335 [Episyrphus balteatus]|uniref:uncharacterized protein LOC129916335 n=1 Tax=Episyrphus balteatus TaxID=286459 RepID=UPI0024859849|nr:uncharacterized protein LOC129916335 [Episyrphus balteatus]